ncbi:NO-inducible flavohemoprotein [Pseudomonas sp. HK3]
MLSQQQIEIVKSTIPLLENAGTAITEHFYKRMFIHNPELQDTFNMSNQASGRQQFALFSAIAAYAKHLENPSVLASMVERIANKHTSLHIQPAQYDIVGHHLIETLRELAADAFTPDVEAAWAAAYGQLAGVFINREEAIYNQNAQVNGGWRGGRQFRLIEKRIESELVKSLVLEPCDGGDVMGYLPGQYIGIEVQPPGGGYKEIRQYSLSDKSNRNSYRISVKRETPLQTDHKAGVVSNYLHDDLRLAGEVTLYPPSGDFYLKTNDKPVVLISAGVGLTPMQSMLETLVAKDSKQPLFYLHACEDSAQHSFKKRNQSLSIASRVTTFTWYNQEQSTLANTFNGYMDLAKIQNQLPLNTADFYICGPVSFMQFAKQQLIQLGVNKNNIHYEVFGPHEDL